MNTRREFLQAGTLFFAPALLPGGSAANDRIRVGIAGVKGRGWALLRSLLEIGKDQNVEVAALCDVDAEVLSQRAAACEKLTGPEKNRRAPEQARNWQCGPAPDEIDPVSGWGHNGACPGVVRHTWPMLQSLGFGACAPSAKALVDSTLDSGDRKPRQ